MRCESRGVLQVNAQPTVSKSACFSVNTVIPALLVIPPACHSRASGNPLVCILCHSCLASYFHPVCHSRASGNLLLCVSGNPDAVPMTLASKRPTNRFEVSIFFCQRCHSVPFTLSFHFFGHSRASGNPYDLHMTLTGKRPPNGFEVSTKPVHHCVYCVYTLNKKYQNLSIVSTVSSLNYRGCTRVAPESGKTTQDPIFK